ncbi:hypothetical protein TNCV_3966071 [Trichonephila clavipes]|nr:hypothetical protein TNCV_3966071 [Trichonephila clavipes]
MKNNHGSIPITVLIFENIPMIPPAYKAHQTVSFSGLIFLHLCIRPNAAVLFVDVAIQPEVFIAKQNSHMKIEQRQSRFRPIRRIYALLDDRFDELPNQTENKMTAVKSVAIVMPP